MTIYHIDGETAVKQPNMVTATQQIFNNLSYSRRGNMECEGQIFSKQPSLAF
jgi:hypothetical protein